MAVKSPRHHWRPFSLALMALLMLGLALAGCDSPRKRALIRQIDTATSRGLSYLNASYSNYSYADEYLLFVYPGENLSCPVEGCRLTYRLLDAYYDVVFLEQAGVDTTAIPGQVEDAHAILENLSQAWEQESIYNTLKSRPDKGGIALDTYCILGYVARSREMAAVAAGYLDESNNWMADDYYVEDSWRNTADESWCVRHFIVSDYDRELSAVLLEKLVNQTDRYLREDHAGLDKLSVAYHTLYAVSEFMMKYGDGRLQGRQGEYQRQVTGSLADVQENRLMLANMLDVLLVSGYRGPGLGVMAGMLLDAQEPEGHWQMTPGAGHDNAQVFTTFRALIALNGYKGSLPGNGP